MSKPFFFIALLFLIGGQTAFAQIFPNLGGQRVGISALTFLKNTLSPRSVGMAGADVTLTGDGYSFNTNPALVSELSGLTIGLSNLTFANSVNHTSLNMALPLATYSKLTLNINNLNSGVMEKRTEFQPNGTGEYFYVGQTVAGVGYAQQLSDMFSFGGQIKVIRESLAEYKTTTMGVDLGFLYRTDFKHLRFAAAVQHFGGNSNLKGNEKPVTYTRNDAITIDEFSAPTLFKMGASIRAIERPDYYLTTAVQLNHPNDNAENIRLGAEFVFRNRFSLRTGYKINVNGEKYPTGGIGIIFPDGKLPLTIDYGFFPSDYLGMYHSVGFYFSLGKKDETPRTVGTVEMN
jgi:hypothetical protein